jgi:hypothetical protein
MPITVSGTQITFNDATVQTTAFTGGGGTVTSVATGNGLQGGTITTSGTLSVACPSFNTVGSYITGGDNSNTSTFNAGSNYSAGAGGNLIQAVSFRDDGDFTSPTQFNRTSVSGTWKWMAGSVSNQYNNFGLCCRVS